MNCKVLRLLITIFVDPDGFLEPGEIFFRSSHRNLELPDGTRTDTIVGDVLLTRHPCKLPTDVQKVLSTSIVNLWLINYFQWKAVECASLNYLTDVIVCSTKGPRRAADFLAGGTTTHLPRILIPEILFQVITMETKVSSYTNLK